MPFDSIGITPGKEDRPRIRSKDILPHQVKNRNLARGTRKSQVFKVDEGNKWVNVGEDPVQYEQDTHIRLYVVENVDDYMGVNVLNPNPGTGASADYIAANDNENWETEGYIDMGINSESFSDADFVIMTAGSGYLFTGSGDLLIGASSASKALYFYVGPESSSSSLKAIINGSGNMGIGTTTPNANAILDVTSTTKAFMPPRMTSTQRDAVASPAAGMIIWNTTTTQLEDYNGAAWAAV